MSLFLFSLFSLDTNFPISHRLFESACDQLNMTSLVEFLSELCMASRHQLRTYQPESTAPVSTMHLYRLGDVVLHCVRSDRPLLHIMRLWSVVSVHLVEVGGMSKK